MSGMAQTTGKSPSDLDHLRQSIVDILTTPIGARVMRPTYGSRLYELVDHPTNRAFRVDVFAATAEALARWEPRLELLSVKISSASPGHVTLALQGRYVPENRPITFDDIEV